MRSLFHQSLGVLFPSPSAIVVVRKFDEVVSNCSILQKVRTRVNMSIKATEPLISLWKEVGQ